jgi:division protein CdvB (Snf7/Vps24/ESCRT-III family)
LADGFRNNWEADRGKVSTSKRLKEILGPQVNLRKKITDTDRAIAVQISKLDSTLVKMGQKEKILFAKTSASYQKHDTAQATVYARELAELRKATKLVTGSKLMLERIQMRLTTVTEIGDLAKLLMPVGKVVRSTRFSLMSIMPSASASLGDITSNLDSLMHEFGTVPGISLDLDPANEDAEKILAEASAVVEASSTTSLPGVPNASTAEEDNAV